MIINEIKRKGKSDKYYLITPNDRYLVTDEIIYTNKIAVGELEDEKFFNLVNHAQKSIAFDESIDILSRGYKTKKEVGDSLRKKGYTEDSIKYAIQKLEEYKYIDDKKYAQVYIETYSKSKGYNLIRNQLMLKGITKNIIAECLDEMPSQTISAVMLAQKFVKTKKDVKNLKEKLYRHLLSKGFGYEDCKVAMDKTLKGECDESWN